MLQACERIYFEYFRRRQKIRFLKTMCVLHAYQTQGVAAAKKCHAQRGEI
jgi:hypothetical protein